MGVQIGKDPIMNWLSGRGVVCIVTLVMGAVPLSSCSSSDDDCRGSMTWNEEISECVGTPPS